MDYFLFMLKNAEICDKIIKELKEGPLNA